MATSPERLISSGRLVGPLVALSARHPHRKFRIGILGLWMEEALRDPNVLEIDPDPSSRSRRSTRTIGYSVIDGFLVTVITLREESTVHGVNGWRSDPPEQCRYRREIER